MDTYTITDLQITALADEAVAALDWTMVAICQLAVGGYGSAVNLDDLGRSSIRNQDSARAECARVIADAQAMAD
jgi:hypothetical protein